MFDLVWTAWTRGHNTNDNRVRGWDGFYFFTREEVVQVSGGIGK